MNFANLKKQSKDFSSLLKKVDELNKPTFGVIAQDVEKVFPELVTQWKLSDDCQDALSVNYEKLVPVLIAAIQELAAKIEKLQTKES